MMHDFIAGPAECVPDPRLVPKPRRGIGPRTLSRSGIKFLDAVFDELIEKRCNHYRQVIGLYVSGTRRVRRVIVGCSTAPPAQTIAVLSDGCCNIESARRAHHLQNPQNR
jgi:hypothetical protein